MKKSVVLLVLAAIAAACIFFLGWTQFKIDKDMYGVTHTRTSGYSEKVLESGSFSWSALSIIPKNMTIIQIPSSRRNVYMTMHGQLPSSDLYASMSIGSPDFSFDAVLEIPYAISRDACVDLVSEYGLNSTNIYTWFSATDEKIRRVAQEMLTFLLAESESAAADTQVLSAELARELDAYFPELDFGEASATFSKSPDMRLYHANKAEYARIQSLKTQALEASISDTPSKTAEDILYLDRLDSYGRLLTEYPVLLEYLRLENQD